jgi:hypothetical protein
MPFVTKLDYSDNRQIKQFEFTNTQLSGSTDFGVHYSGLTGGVLLSSVVVTGTLSGITSTFSGNSTTTNIVFSDARLISGAVSLYAITDITSGDTQTGSGYTGIDSYELDGNTIYSAYTGSTYDFTVTSIEEVGTELWTGETISNNTFLLSGGSSDYSDRTIWVDVLGITKTKRLILDDDPDIDNTLTYALGRNAIGDVVKISTSGFTGGGGGSNTDDYVVSGTYDNVTGLLELTRFSGGTLNVDLEITSGDTSNWNSAYDDTITGVTISGAITKTITLGQRDGGTVSTMFTDLTASGGTDNDYTTGSTFNTTNGILEFTRFSGDTYNVDLDGRYLESSGATLQAVTDNGNTTTNSILIDNGKASFTIDNGTTSSSVLVSETMTFTIDGVRSAAYNSQSAIYTNIVSGGTLSLVPDTITASAAIVTIPHKTGTIALLSDLSGFTTGSTVNTDDYTTGATFNTTDGVLEFTTQSGNTYNVDLDDRYSLTGHTHETDNTDDYLTGGTFNTGTGDLDLTLQSGSTVTINLDNRYSLTGHTHTGLADDYLTGHTFNTSNGNLDSTLQSGSTVSVNLDGRYAYSSGHTHTLSDITDYIIVDDYTTGTTFNTSTGILEFTRVSGGTFNVDLDGRYLTGFTETPNTDDYLTGHTFNTSNGNFESTLQSGGTVSVNLDGRYAFSSGHTHVIADITDYVPTDDYVTGSTFNTTNGLLISTRLSGGTFNVDLDGRYLPTSGYTAPTGLEALDEGNGDGYRLIGTDPADYNNVGEEAIDLSFVLGGTSDYGAQAKWSIVAGGVNNKATAQQGVVIGGSTNTNTGSGAAVIIGGQGNSNAGGGGASIVGSNASTIAAAGQSSGIFAGGQIDINETYALGLGGFRNTVDSEYGVVISGRDNTAHSYGEIVTGLYSTDYSATSINGWVGTDRMFNIGNGTSEVARSDVFQVLKKGDVIAPSLTTDIIGSGDSKTLITREYGELYYSLTGHTHVIADITDFTDNSTQWDSAYGDTITGMTVTGTTTKTISLFQRDGGLVQANFTDAVGVGAGNDYTTGSTFNTTNGILEFTRFSGGTYTVDLDGRYSLTGHTHAEYLTGYTDTNDYLTGGTFNTANGELDLNLQSGSTITIDLDGRYLPTSAYTDTDTNVFVTGSTFNTGDGILEFTNTTGGTFNVDLDGRYLTGFTETPNTDDFVTGATFNTGDGILEFTTQSGTTFNVDLDNRYSLTGHTHATDNTDDYVTGHTFNTTTGLFESTLQSGSTISVNLDGRYSLTGHTHALADLSSSAHTHTISEITDFPTNVSYFTNDVGYLTANTVNTDDYVTGHTFNTSNGLLTSTTKSGSTFNVDLDGRYLNVTASTANSNDYLTGGTFNTATGDLDLGLQSGSTVTINLDDRYSLTGHTHADTNTDDYVTGHTFNTTNGLLTSTRVSGGTFSVDLDGRYLTGFTETPNTDDYVTGTTFNTGDGVLEFTRLSGGTFNVDLDGRYALTGDTIHRQISMIPEPSGFTYVTFNILKNDGEIIIDDIDWEEMFRTKYSSDIQAGESYVNPLLGSDSYAGTKFAPYATINKAIDSSGSTIYLYNGVHDFIDFRDTDVEGDKAKIIIGLGDDVVMKQEGEDFQDLTFVMSTSPDTFETTATTSNWINRVLRTDILDDDGNPTPIPVSANAAAVDTDGYGWYYDTSTKVLTIRISESVGGDDATRETWFNDNMKPLLDIKFIGTAAGTQRIYIQNTKVFFKNITIEGGYFFANKTAATSATTKPTIWTDNVNMLYGYNTNVLNGGEFFFKDSYFTRFLGDNLGYHVADSVQPQAVEYNVKSTYAGDVDGDPTTTANKNCSSMHDAGTILRINGEYNYAYPYNVVDTSTENSWNLGVKSKGASATDIIFFNGTGYLDHVYAKTIIADAASEIIYNDLTYKSLTLTGGGVLTEYQF